MSGPTSSADQVARDDAHLESLGIKPELKRSLGFLSNFAVAFAYISVSTGTYTLIGLGLAVGGPSFFWSWPLVVVGQLFVALNFAELSSHFPVAGSIYQWSKRLSNRTLGLFTGWIYFWAGVLTVTAVAATVPLVLSTIFGFTLSAPSPIPALDNLIFWALLTLISTTLINAFGVRLMSIINNLGVAAEIVGMLVFALILLIFFHHQPLSILTTTAGLEISPAATTSRSSSSRCSCPCSSSTASTPPGPSARKRSIPAARRPAGSSPRSSCQGAVGAVFLLAIILSFKDVPAEIASAQAFGFPIGDTILANMQNFGNIYLAVILFAVFVCTMAIQGATTRLMFSMGRDRRMPFGGVWAHVNTRFKTPANAAIAVGILAAIPLLVSDSPATLAIGATGLIYMSYFLCNLGVMIARRRGWPHQGAWFKLRIVGHDHQPPGPDLGRRDDHQLRALELEHVRCIGLDVVHDSGFGHDACHRLELPRPDQPAPQHVDIPRRQARLVPAADPPVRVHPRPDRDRGCDLLPGRVVAAGSTSNR